MKKLSNIASNVVASSTLAVDSLAKEMRAAGKDVIGFGAGEPDFDTPEHIKQIGIHAIETGRTKYTPAAGMMELRRAIADRLQADMGVHYEPTQIVVASGAKHNVYLTLRALINSGDEVIIPAPYWVTYLEAVKMAGGTPVVVSAGEEQDFKITPQQLQAAVTDNTKLFLLNNPSNPTGMVYSEAELRELCDVCVEHDLYIMADEIYYHLVYDGIFTSVAALGERVKERTILVNGVSKSYAMTGWRIGYTASSPEIAKVMTNYVSHSTSSPATMSQIAAIEALSGPQGSVFEMKEAFEERRDYMCKRINAMDGVSCLVPQGAFYVMMNLTGLLGKTLGGREITDGDSFAMVFLDTAQVAVVPCSGFGTPNFVRLSYASSIENIKAGMDRLETFLKGATTL
ncbi:MAG: pyridoxal phosphate-dependent aminotransferase [Oscillospiraceae bacterium]|nr:pyridoxal phosphate-dependent aminotransferase [Oscillospiraceae bacterium]